MTTHPKPDTRAAAVLGDELDAGSFQSHANILNGPRHHCLARFKSPDDCGPDICQAAKLPYCEI